VDERESETRSWLPQMGRVAVQQVAGLWALLEQPSLVLPGCAPGAPRTCQSLPGFLSELFWVSWGAAPHLGPVPHTATF
jgi:hypothetical protein